MDEERRDQPDEQPAAQPEPAREPRTSGMAVTSLILGICAFLTCGVTALPGLIFGIIGLVQTGRNRTLKGQGIALAGTILSAVAVLILPIMAAIMFPVFARARHAAQKSNCINNIKQISTAMQMYTSDWDETYPLAANWNDSVAKYLRPSDTAGSAPDSKVWTCPAVDTSEPTYALNVLLAEISEEKIVSPVETVGVYESVPGRDLTGEAELLPSPPRHDDGNNIGFADGHVKWVEKPQFGGLRWDPGAKASPKTSTEEKEVCPPVG